MEVTLKCPTCGSSLAVARNDMFGQIKCGRCNQMIVLSISQAIREGHRVDLCPLCEGSDFYIRKDFDPSLGLTVVIIGALVSATFYWFSLDLIAYGILAGAVLIDLLIYQWLGDVTVCYRCHTEFRGISHGKAQAFDLHIADVLEHEYAQSRERQLKRRGRLEVTNS